MLNIVQAMLTWGCNLFIAANDSHTTERGGGQIYIGTYVLIKKNTNKQTNKHTHRNTTLDARGTVQEC